LKLRAVTVTVLMMLLQRQSSWIGVE